MCIYNLTVAGFLSLLLSVCVVRLFIINKFFVFCFFFPVQNIDTDMLAISFLLVAIEDLCHGIHIFQAQNGGFCDPIILLLKSCCKDLSLHAISVWPLLYFGIVIQCYFP